MVIKVGTFRSYEDRLQEIQAQAAYWVAREHDPAFREAERIELREWLALSPAHELEYTLADSLYADADLAAALADLPRIQTQAKRRSLPPIWSRFTAALHAAAGYIRHTLSWPHLIAATCGLALAYLAVTQLAPLPGPLAAIEDPRLAQGMPLATVAGERLISEFPDGTRVELGGDSSAHVRFEPGLRHFRLDKGDAHFAVGHDAKRPFLITTPRAQIRVVGTRFLISQLPDFMRLDVYEGTVEIRTGPEDGQVLQVHKGSRVTIGSDVRIERFDPRSEEDWRAGWVDEGAITLAELAQLAERRTGMHVEVQPALANLTISGRFRITDPTKLFTNLRTAYGFEVISEGNTLIVRK